MLLYFKQNEKTFYILILIKKTYRNLNKTELYKVVNIVGKSSDININYNNSTIYSQ